MSVDVFAAIGTDHHPFDRMVAWLDRFAEAHPDLSVMVQHGSTRGPSIADGVDFLGYAELLALLGGARVVVCHGGPATVMDARGAGHVPLCLPRDPALGEHVDGHQVRFARHAASEGLVQHVTSYEELEAGVLTLLAEARGDSAAEPTVGRGVPLLAAELDRLLEGAPQPRRRTVIGWWRHGRGGPAARLGQTTDDQRVRPPTGGAR